METGIEVISDRAHAWLLGLVNRIDSPVYDLFMTVEKSDKFPDLSRWEEAKLFFPGLLVLYQTGRDIEGMQSAAVKNLHAEHVIQISIFNALQDPLRAGLDIAAMMGKVVKLFRSDPQKRVPRDPDFPEDLSKALWRPVDCESTGLSIYELYAESWDLSDPLPISDEVLIERADILIMVRGSSR